MNNRDMTTNRSTDIITGIVVRLFCIFFHSVIIQQIESDQRPYPNSKLPTIKN